MNTKEVQTALRDLGWPIGVDGSFGPATRQAVLDFQQGFSFHDLLVDGFAGPQTHEALRHCLGAGGRCGSHFAFREFKSKGDGWIKVHRELVRALDRYRQRYGPTTIVSGHRDLRHNQKVRGAKNSQHLYGTAVDIPAVASVAAVERLGLFSGIGYRARDGMVVHVDVRHAGVNTTGGSPAAPTTWKYG